jgi:UDP-glucose 4-epimerase
VLELSHAVAQAMGVTPQIVHLEPRVEVMHAFADHSKARSCFGTGEPLSLGQGIHRMAAWAKQQTRMTQSIFGDIEIEKNMPKSWRKPESVS